ncbi:MAG: ABC transporter ATP-binding protein [Rhodospirillales bacterium]|nr:ABC transporter ATP-binding protein [Rhodospirillales bacterium]MDP6646017.1 ABC transporter ATP-binding protein [Rhodospirillales bacterium]MDP6841202.1 ABC transporter ATP-binding protein [Rhodospirillales bacterium]
MTSPPIIAVDDVRKSFGGLTALNGCSLSVAEGSITGLIGPNGAGKTTLFNIMAGAIRADSGQIRIADISVNGQNTHVLFHRGLVRTFQVPAGFPRLTVRENLMVVPAGQAGETLTRSWFDWPRVRAREAEVRGKADEVLEFLDLTGVAEISARQLSGGQKKLLELGRTMMTDARIVLLDEPGAGVNRSLLKRITGAIRSLNSERGYTFCIIEHDMDLIAELCDPVIVMAQGRVLAEGTLGDVRANPEVLDAYFGGGAPAS